MRETVGAVARFFERGMLPLILLSVAAGFCIGYFSPGATPGLRRYIGLTLFLMLYPMMIGVRVDQLGRAVRSLRIISWSAALNFVVSPLLGFVLAGVFLNQSPPLAVALILLSATPCAGMVAGWTGMARGNVPLAMVIVAFSLVLSIVTIPLTMLLLAGTLVPVDPVAVMQATVFVILLPLIGGDLTRRFIIRVWGEAGYQSIRPLLSPLSMLGMFSIIVISVSLGTPGLLVHYASLLLAFPALVLFYGVQTMAGVRVARRIKLETADLPALVFSVLGKNSSLAIGLAVQFLPPMAVTLLAANPLIQAPAMALFLRWSRGLALSPHPVPQEAETLPDAEDGQTPARRGPKR